PDGVTFTPSGSTQISMSATVLVGMAVSAHSATVTNEADFDHVEVTVPTSPPVTPPPPNSQGCPTTSGRKFYISPSGSDSAAGDSGHPWRTFARAYQTLAPGDQLRLQDGEYKDSLAAQKLVSGSWVPVSGTQASPIDICAEHDGQAVVNGEGVRIPMDFSRG